MSEPLHRILGCLERAVVRLRVMGRAVAHQCPAAREFVKRGLDAGAREVRVELAECEYCDSTFMGTLLRIRKAAADAGAEGPILVAPSPEAEAIVRKMGLLRLFATAAACSDPGAEWEPLEQEAAGTTSWDFKENVVTAHRELADSSDTAAAIYDTIADVAAAELERTPRDEATSGD